MKKLIATVTCAMLLAGCSSNTATSTSATSSAGSEDTTTTTSALPDARDTEKTYTPSEGADETACEVNTYAAACSSITSENLTEYLNRDDVLYIDLRDYSDYSKKHLRNFEVVPYFALIFNENAGTEGNPQLYSGTVAEPVATYEESDLLLEEYFPKDTTIFLMCQSGGRVSQLMTLLEAKGYDMSKIYNVGGMGQFTGSEYKDITVDAAEVTVDATYNFEGLTAN